jgi:hypothetical protein
MAAMLLMFSQLRKRGFSRVATSERWSGDRMGNGSSKSRSGNVQYRRPSAGPKTVCSLVAPQTINNSRMASIDIPVKQILKLLPPWRTSASEFPPKNFCALLPVVVNEALFKSEARVTLSDTRDLVKRTGSNSPTKVILLSNNVQGGFPPEVFDELSRNNGLAREIVQDLLDAHFPETIHRDILDAVGIEFSIETRVVIARDPEF